MIFAHSISHTRHKSLFRTNIFLQNIACVQNHNLIRNLKSYRQIFGIFTLNATLNCPSIRHIILTWKIKCRIYYRYLLWFL